MTGKEILDELRRRGFDCTAFGYNSTDLSYALEPEEEGKRPIRCINADGAPEQWQAILSGQQQGEQAPRRYRHWKGGVHEVLGNVTHHEDLSPWVRYRKVGIDQEWIRPFDEFHGTVEVPGGQWVSRFQRIEGEQAPLCGRYRDALHPSDAVVEQRRQERERVPPAQANFMRITEPIRTPEDMLQALKGEERIAARQVELNPGSEAMQIAKGFVDSAIARLRERIEAGRQAPPQPPTPSEYIKLELDARGWTVEDLAIAAGCDAANLRRVIEDNALITAAIATGLSKAFGTSEQVWLNLQNANRGIIRSPDPVICEPEGPEHPPTPAPPDLREAASFALTCLETGHIDAARRVLVEAGVEPSGYDSVGPLPEPPTKDKHYERACDEAREDAWYLNNRRTQAEVEGRSNCANRPRSND